MATELRQALRYLSRRPGFSAAIVLTIALSVAATTVAFAVVDRVLFEPLPYERPDELLVVWEHNIARERQDNVVSSANFLTWRERSRSITGLSSAVSFSATLTGRGDPERIGVVEATASMFPLIGAEPLLGRLYGEAEDSPGGGDVVVLSEGYWRRAFGSDPSILGGTIDLNGSPFTVLGVLPARYDVAIVAEFGGTGTHDAWLPPQFDEDSRSETGRYLQIFGRLADGATIETARAEMTALAAQLREEFPDRQAGWDITVVPLREQVVGDVSTALIVMFGAVCFVLLIACGNVANLFLTGAAARQREMAVRSALGSGRARLFGQLFVESGVLAFVGGALGLLLAAWSFGVLVAAAPDIPRLDVLDVDVRVVGFALLATLATAVLVGFAPALHVAGGELGEALKDRGGSGARRGGNRLRGALVITQVALSLVLLVGAGLLIRSLANRLALGVGLEVDRLLTAEVSLPSSAYSPEQRALFFESLVERAKGIAGVREASAITFAPLTGLGSATSFWPLDRPVPPDDDQPVADLRWVHRDYHEVSGIPLIAGRFFDITDGPGTPFRIVLNESGARQLWPGESAIGKRIAMPWGDTIHAEVIGVVGDVLFNGPETELRPMFYWDHRQFQPFGMMTLMVRASGDPAAIVPGVRAAVRELDANLPLFNVETMSALYGDALARPRFATLTLGAFAALALLLAAIGIYGVISHVTGQRAREIGIRMALGARRPNVLWLVLSRGVVLIGIGVAVGAVGAFGLTRLLTDLVFGVSTTDAVTFTGMTATLAAIGLVACWVPARRASRIDPVEAIRDNG